MTRSPKRQPSLNRLLDELGVPFWLSDANGEIAYLSPPMSELLGEDRLSETNYVQTQAALASPSDVTRHGHRTLTLSLCKVAASGPGGTIDSAPLELTVHYVRLGDWTLGFVDQFVPDDQVDIEAWLGDHGIRQNALVDKRLSRHRATVGHIAGVMLSGESTASRQLRGRVALATKVHDHVGVFGPSGCGGEWIARQIHHTGSPEESLVTLDASLMDQELLQAYAGPTLRELVDTETAQATLLMSRIDEMPTDGQRQLFQWMQTWPERLRVIGIAKPLENETALMPELVEALSVLSVTVPPLDSRTEDLETMVRGLIVDHSSGGRLPNDTPEMSREFFDLLLAYPWPGQWDELSAAIRFACDAVRGHRFAREHLPLAVRSFRKNHGRDVEIVEDSARAFQVRPTSAKSISLGNRTLDEAVSDFERQLIEQALEQASGNKAEAARRLGISRARLLRKLGPLNE